MKTFLEISISASPSQRELLIPTMIELGCDGFQELDTALLCYIEKTRWSERKYQKLQDDLTRLLHTISSNTLVLFKEIVEENWNEQWERSLQPIQVGKRLVVKPSWTQYANDEGRITITIDPKMSFGTGYHETTRLTLELVERYVSPGSSVLDVGTGTGILAIAAVKFGAGSVIAIDTDHWSIENAGENAVINGVADNIIVSDVSLDHLEHEPFDLIAANLTLNTNIELLPHFAVRLRQRGILLVSGLLHSDRVQMTDHLQKLDFRVIEELVEHDWIAIAAGKR